MLLRRMGWGGVSAPHLAPVGGCQGLGRELGIVLGMGSYGIMPLPRSFTPRTEL